MNTQTLIKSVTATAAVAMIAGFTAAPASAQATKKPAVVSCSAAGIAALQRAVQAGAKRKMDRAALDKANFRLMIAERAMAEKDRTLCTVALRSGRAALASAGRPTSREAARAARYCTPANFKRLNASIQAGVKQKLNPKAIAIAKARYAGAKKALAGKNRPACGNALRSVMLIMARARRGASGAAAAAKFCSSQNFSKLNGMIRAGTQRKVNAQALTAAKSRYARAKAAHKAKNLPSCGGALRSGMGIMTNALRAKK